MDITQWYAVALGAIVAACVLFTISRVIIKVSHTYAFLYFLKYVFYPEILRYPRGSDIITQILRYLRGPDTTTPFDTVLITGFVVGNILCVTIGAGNISGLIGRTGLIAAINLVPLALGGHMNLIASYCGVALGGYGRIHRWLGRVAIIEGSVHSIMAARSRKPDLHVPSQMAALIAISAMATILAFSLAIVQRHFYEIVLKLHLALAVAVVAGVWVHVWSRKPSVPQTIYMITAICVWASTNLIRLAYILYRNVKYARPRMEDVALGDNPILSEKLTHRRTRRVLMTNRAKLIAMPGGVQVHVKLVQPWRFGAGQTVYLCLPGVSHSAFLQSHPFVLSWWYKSAKGDDIAVFIIRPRRGFTRIIEDIAPKPREDWMKLARSAEGLKLESYDTSRSKERKAIIEGPYGNELNLESFDTVLLFASGIRIAAQLPYVRQLLQQHYSWVAKTSRIALFWEMESELWLFWVRGWMQELIREDIDYILGIQLFVLGDYLSPTREYGDIEPVGDHNLIATNYMALDAKELIRSEIEGRKGRTVVSICVDSDTESKVREVVGNMLDKKIRLVKLDFGPSDPVRVKNE